MSDNTLRNKQIAETILYQLGGSIFTLMTGSKNFVAIDDGVQFNVGSDAKHGVNKMRIVLTPDDTYDVSALKVNNRTGAIEELCAISGIYNDQLQDAFYSCTGFYCSMNHSRTACDFFLGGEDRLADSPNRASPQVEPEDALAAVPKPNKVLDSFF